MLEFSGNARMARREKSGNKASRRRAVLPSLRENSSFLRDENSCFASRFHRLGKGHEDFPKRRKQLKTQVSVNFQQTII